MKKLLGKKCIFVVLAVLLAFWWGSACAPRQEVQELRVFAAASLRDPMNNVISKFQEKEKNVKVIANYDASGKLYTQIKEGQPCDLFLSADWKYIEKGLQEGKLAEGRKWLKEKLVLVVSAGGRDKVKTVEDLAKPGVTVAIADPKAPVGIYSERALMKALGIWDKVEKNIKARPGTVQDAAVLVKENQVDATLIYTSVAKQHGLTPIQVIEERYSGEILFGVGIVKGGKEALAKKFLEFCQQNLGEFTKYGWEAP